MSETVKVLLSRIREKVEESRSTDYIMPVFLPFIPALLMIVGGIIFGVSAVIFTSETLTYGIPATGISLIGIGTTLTVAGLIVNIYVIYEWVNRRNKHFLRTQELYETITELAEKLKFDNVSLLKSRLNELKAYSKTRRPVLNAILSMIVPFYVFYVYHFLNKDFVKHGEREALYLADLIDEIKKKHKGFTRRVEELKKVPNRSTLLYIILTIITGLFVIYWVYTLTKDPNEHFETHVIMEKDILDALNEIASSAQ